MPKLLNIGLRFFKICFVFPFIRRVDRNYYARYKIYSPGKNIEDRLHPVETILTISTVGENNIGTPKKVIYFCSIHLSNISIASFSFIFGISSLLLFLIALFVIISLINITLRDESGKFSVTFRYHL